MSMKKIFASLLFVSTLCLSAGVSAKNIYQLPVGETTVGRITLIYPVMGEDGMSVKQYERYKNEHPGVPPQAQSNNNSIGSQLGSVFGGLVNTVKSNIGLPTTSNSGDSNLNRNIDERQDNDPYSEPDDYISPLGENNGGYRLRVVLDDGDIYNVYVSPQNYNKLINRGMVQGGLLRITGGKNDKNLMDVAR